MDSISKCDNHRCHQLWSISRNRNQADSVFAIGTDLTEDEDYKIFGQKQKLQPSAYIPRQRSTDSDNNRDRRDRKDFRYNNKRARGKRKT